MILFLALRLMIMKKMNYMNAYFFNPYTHS